ncbi:MAG: stage III sporulation protein AE [Oscillospiraceae bacterium]|jgi:stage III sporulation protein AE|nr:stage III sporulation protein AE [Oscillospiraceae bacterium]
MRRVLTIIIVIILLIPPSALALDVFAEQSDAIGADNLGDALPDGADDILGGMGVSDALDAPGAISRLVSGITSKLRGIVTSSLRSAAVIVMAAMLSGLFTSAFPDKSANYARLAGVFAISAVSVASVNTFIGMGAAVIDDLGTFSKLLLPCLTAAAVAGGAVTSAAIKYSVTVMFLDILMNLMRTIIMPLIYAYAAVSVAEAAIGGDALSGVSSLIKWLAKTVLTAIVLVFVLYMSLTGVIAGASDAAALRAAKVTISTVFPVVGTILADAAGTLLSGAAILRNAVGVFGVLAVAATCAVPFLKLGVNYLLFKAAGGLSATVADASVTKLINAFGAAFGMTLGMAGVAAVMLFVSIVSTIKTVT